VGSAEAEQARWVTQLGGDPQALLHALDVHVPTPEAALAQITTPVLVAVGDQDHGHVARLLTAIRHVSGKRPENSGHR
jgi:pimeloyl-ACP methyl ester carboxylesterase